MAYAGPFPHTNTGTTSGIYVAVTSFSGNVGNTGVIAIGGLPGGIVIIGSSINGAVSNGGTISTILPRKSGIGIVNSTVTGSVSNSGSISVDLTAIGISNAIISGGISNSGTITSQQLAAGIRLSGLTTFGGGISNGRGGTISAGTAVAVDSVAGFVGDISNAGLLTGRTGIGIATAALMARS